MQTIPNNEAAKARHSMDKRIALALRRDLVELKLICADRANVLAFCRRLLAEPGAQPKASFDAGAVAGSRTRPHLRVYWLSLLTSAAALLALVTIARAEDKRGFGAPVILPSVPMTPMAPFSRSLERPNPPSPQEIGAMFSVDLPGALDAAREHHAKRVKDYTCTVIRQEFLGDRLWPEQEIHVIFRQRPFSVVMHWVRNMARVERAIYIEGRWRNQDATGAEELEQAIFQPSGLSRLFAKSVFRPIHCEEVRAGARRTMDQFGFERGLLALAESARQTDAVVFVGPSRALGRPTWLLKRRKAWWNSARRQLVERGVFHIDQEHLVPIAVYLYDDDGQTKLVGRYEFSNIRMNAGLRDQDFEPQTYGM